MTKGKPAPVGRAVQGPDESGEKGNKKVPARGGMDPRKPALTHPDAWAEGDPFADLGRFAGHANVRRR